MIRAILFIPVFTLIFALPVFGQQASRADFEELLQVMEGRYICDVIWIADWPGTGGKKGEKVTGYGDLRVVADGNVLAGTFYGGNGTGNWITVYDTAAKQIKSLQGNSGGTVWNAVWYKENGKWMSVGTGSNPDGSKIEFKNMVTLSDNGKTHNWSGSSTIGGKPAGELEDVCRRVNE